MVSSSSNIWTCTKLAWSKSSPFRSSMRVYLSPPWESSNSAISRRVGSSRSRCTEHRRDHHRISVEKGVSTREKLPLWAWIGPPLMATRSFSWAPDGIEYSSRQNSSCSSIPPHTSCCWYTGIPMCTIQPVQYTTRGFTLKSAKLISKANLSHIHYHQVAYHLANFSPSSLWTFIFIPKIVS